MKKITFKFAPGEHVVYVKDGICHATVEMATVDERTGEIKYKLSDNDKLIAEREIYPDIETFLDNFKKLLIDVKKTEK